MTDEDKYFNWLIEEGAIEITSIRDDGEFIYGMTPRLKEIAPEFYEEWVSGVNGIVTNLWHAEVISLVWTDDDVLLTLTEKAFDPEVVDNLDDFEREVLMEIINDFAEGLAALERSEESEE